MSKGGQTCRNCKVRHVRCDRQKPTCGRCLSSGKECIRLDREEALMLNLHSENQFASGASKRPRGPRSHFKSGRSLIELEHRALRLYLRDFIQPASTRQIGGLSECVRAWERSSRRSYLVDLALVATALAVYGKVKVNRAASRAGMSHYSRLLTLIQRQIELCSVSSEHEFDELLLCLFLMGRFETIMHDDLSEEMDSRIKFSHHDGVGLVLKLWTDECIDRSSVIVKLTRRGQLRSCLLRGNHVPDHLHGGAFFGEQDDELTYDKLFVRLINAHSTLLKMESTQDEPSNLTDHLNVEFEEIYQALQQWSDTLPAFKKHEWRRSSTDSGPPSTELYSFSSPADGSVWAQFFAAMLLLTVDRFRALQLYNRPISGERKKVMLVSCRHL